MGNVTGALFPENVVIVKQINKYWSWGRASPRVVEYEWIADVIG